MEPAVTKVHDEASIVSNAAGAVAMDGPGGVAVTLTPEAAAETADRLLECANEALVTRERQDPATPGGYCMPHDKRAPDQRH